MWDTFHLYQTFSRLEDLYKERDLYNKTLFTYLGTTLFSWTTYSRYKIK